MTNIEKGYHEVKEEQYNAVSGDLIWTVREHYLY